jgi:hypothetical protein
MLACDFGAAFAVFIPLDVNLFLPFSIFLLEVGSVWYRNLYEAIFSPNFIRLASGLLQFIYFFVIAHSHKVLHAVFPR